MKRVLISLSLLLGVAMMASAQDCKNGRCFAPAQVQQYSSKEVVVKSRCSSSSCETTTVVTKTKSKSDRGLLSKLFKKRSK